jgi:hypothetical protein
MQYFGSLRRLVLDITALAILIAIIRIFPEPSLKTALIAGRFVPSLATCALFTLMCRNKTRAMLVTCGGALVGWLLTPTVWISFENPNWYDAFGGRLDVRRTPILVRSR